ncbi:ABC transporter permease [Cellulomonas chengniuliangii]|uniref:Transport permease protein n=1 Tax=Cellulomonas chengniuliangii TaxID=2968084 RepID=A0ABY5KWM0_9CELL|nr:ABC transporter permease [Cellulomonas chengniuliangii]MCC2309608.1 ABC transporter permease [Cellulomonas chengniuliangii]MCC2318903.1 ABC transporter permease [Cellulomonas chengniuliangii]UUI74839.1 ABC transporter permease [Cellulomonas chengniuliangii]
MTAVDPRRPADAPARGRLPGVLRLGLSRTWLELRLFFRERDAIVFILAYPVIMLAIFSTVFGQDGNRVGPPPGIPYAQYFLPGMVATGVMLSSFQSVALMIATERDEGGLKRLRATPLPASAYFLGKVGQVLVISIGQTALLLLLAATAFDVPMPRGGAWLTFAWVFVLGTATGTVCGVAFSSAPRSGRSAAAVVTPIVLVLQFISGVFFVFNDLPAWMQQVASVFPLKWMAQGMRSVFLPAEAESFEVAGSWQHGATVAVLLAWLVVGLLVGVRTFRWRRRDDG